MASDKPCAPSDSGAKVFVNSMSHHTVPMRLGSGHRRRMLTPLTDAQWILDAQAEAPQDFDNSVKVVRRLLDLTYILSA